MRKQASFFHRLLEVVVSSVGMFVFGLLSISPVSAAVDLCQGLIMDKLNHPMTTLAKPGLLQTAIDPQFGTTIRRISNAGTNHVVKPMYSTIPAWNADESLMILYHTSGAPYAGQHVLYDGKTYQLIRALNDTAADLEQIHWDTINPSFFYYPSNYNNLARFIKYDVRTDTETVLHNFALAPTSCPNNGSLSFGSDPQYMSWEANKKVVGLQCGNKKFAYNISTDTVLGIATISSVNAPVVAPSGNLMYLDGKVYDTATFSLQRTLPMAVVDEHASIGREADGTDVYNAIDFDGSPAGNLISWNLQTGTKDPVISEATGYPYPITGTHISSIATQNPGFVSVDMIGEGTGKTLLDNEIVVVDLNTDRVCRAAHHHSADGPQGYWAEPHANISPSGTRIAFASDWGGTNTVDTYVLELPAYFASQGPDTTPPTLPSSFNLAANATSSSNITVSWNPATDDVGVTGYQVERCTGLSCSNFTQVGTPTASPFTDTGLTVSTGYSYHVRAVDAAGNVSGWSNVVSATTQGSPTFSSCSTVTPTNFTDPTYTGYGAPYDVFASNTPLISTQCSSTDTHTLTATLGIPGDTTRIVYTKGYYYDPGINDWTSFTGTCTGALNGEWCQGSVATSITDTDISTASVSDPSYLVGFTCRSQNGSWKCGCRDTACANFYWQVQGAGM